MQPLELSELMLVALRLILATVDQGAIDTKRQGQAKEIYFPYPPVDNKEKLPYNVKVEGLLMNNSPIAGAVHFVKKGESGGWSDGEVTAFLKLGSTRYTAELRRNEGRLQVRVSRGEWMVPHEAVSVMELRQL